MTSSSSRISIQLRPIKRSCRKPEGGEVTQTNRAGATTYSFNAGSIKFSLSSVITGSPLNGKFTMYYTNGQHS